MEGVLCLFRLPSLHVSKLQISTMFKTTNKTQGATHNMVLTHTKDHEPITILKSFRISVIK